MTIRIGAGLIVLSFLCWLAIPLVPVVGLRGGAAAAAVVGLVVLAEVIFWLGLILVGRETWAVARQQGWRRVPAELWHLLRYGRRLTRG